MGPDPDLARAAAAALGNISAAKELRAALATTKGATRVAVADASLICAERLLAGGKRAEAMALYASLSATDIPPPLRLAAMNGIIREEPAIGRPK